MRPTLNPHESGGFRDDRRDMLLFLALVALCYLDKILLGPYAFVDFYDTLEVHFAHFQNMFRLWREFGAFSWYPFSAGGVPSFVGQHPPYHPAVFLSGLLPIWLLSLVWNMGQMFLAGYGMLRCLRLLVRPSRPVRLFCAAAFALTWISGNVHIVFSYAFPAFFAWTTDLARPDLPRRTRLGAALGLLLVSLFSFPVLTLPHFPMLHLAFVLFLGGELPHFRRQVALVFAVWTGYVLLFAPSIASLYLYIPFAQRDWGFHYPGLAAAFLDLLRFLHGRLTDLHLLPLFLLSLTLIRQRRYQAMLALFALVLLIAGLFSSDMKGLFANTFLAKMDLFLFATAMDVLGALMAALTLEHYRRADNPLSWKVVLACAAVLTLFGSAHVVLRNLFLLAACVGLLELLRPCGSQLGMPSRLVSGRPVTSATLCPAPRGLVPLRLAPLLLAVGLAGLGMFTRQEFMTAGSFVPYARGFGAHPLMARLGRASTAKPFRVAALDVHPALLQAYGLDTVGGKGPLFNKRYKQLVKEAVRPQLANPKIEAAFEGVWRQTYLTRNQGDHDQRPLALTPDKPRNAADFNLGLLRLMGVTHLVSAWPVAGLEAQASQPVVDPGRERGLYGMDLLDKVYALPLYDYVLKDAPGLAHLADGAELADSPEELLRNLGAASQDKLLHTAFLERADVPPGLAPVLQGLTPRNGEGAEAVSLESWSPDRLVFTGRTTGPALLVVANNYDPRWTAKVNGVGAPLLRADHAFQAVPLEAGGKFTAELTFSSPLIWRLHALSVLGLALMLGWALPRRRPPLPGAPGLDPCATTEPPAQFPGLAPGAAASAPLGWSAPRLALAGLCAAAIWALGFGLFILRRHPHDQTLLYALYTIPLIGVAVAVWTGALLRRLFARP